MKTKTTLKLSSLAITFMLITTTLTAQWTPVNNGLPATTTAGVANVRDTLFTAVKNHGVYYSVNNGDNWTAWKHNSKLTTTNINKFEGLAVFSASVEGNYFSLYGNSMFDFYFSQGGGAAFFNYNTPNKNINGWVLTEDSSTDTKYDVLGTNDGVYYSIDGKQTWTKSSGLNGDALIVNDVQVNSNQSGHIFASTNDGMYKSEDYGKSFTAARNGINAGIKIYNDNFLIATSNGIYTYNNNDDIFAAAINTGDFRTTVVDYPNLISYAFGNGVAKKINFANSAIDDITQENLTGGIINSCIYIKEYLFVSTDNGGVFRINRETSLSTDNLKSNKPTFNIYPNPSNGQLTIKSTKDSIFDLYSIEGKLIKSFNVINYYSTSLNLDSGVYFIRERNSKSIKKLIIN